MAREILEERQTPMITIVAVSRPQRAVVIDRALCRLLPLLSLESKLLLLYGYETPPLMRLAGSYNRDGESLCHNSVALGFHWMKTC